MSDKIDNTNTIKLYAKISIRGGEVFPAELK